jgi:hypothetical protein
VSPPTAKRAYEHTIDVFGRTDELKQWSRVWMAVFLGGARCCRRSDDSQSEQQISLSANRAPSAAPMSSGKLAHLLGSSIAANHARPTAESVHRRTVSKAGWNRCFVVSVCDYCRCRGQDGTVIDTN